MNKAILGGCAGAILLAAACGADPLFLNETDTVMTIRAEGSEFSAFETFYLPDSIVDLCLQPEEGTPTSAALGGAGGGPSIDPGHCFSTDHSIDEAILAALARNMKALGYKRMSEKDKDSADVVLLVGLVSKSTWLLNKPYCYPNSYYSGCVDQAGNPAAVVPNNALVLQLIDPEASSGSQLESIWTAALHQLQTISLELGTSLGGGPSATKQTIMIRAIDQAFAQSPYLAEGGTK